jgi:hypothetical protein
MNEDFFITIDQPEDPNIMIFIGGIINGKT